MSWSKYFLLAVTFPLACCAKSAVDCPAYLGSKSNVLVGADLFDGPATNKAALAPDWQNGATWDIRSYNAPEDHLFLVCRYKSGNKEIEVPKSAKSCTVSNQGDSVWCN